jgi:hypothetical protein
MKPQGGLPSFVARYPLAALLAASGLLLAGLGYAQQGYELWLGGIKPWQLHAGGAALFATSVAMMIYRWDQERHPGSAVQPAAAAAPAPDTVHNITSHNQSGGITAYTVNQAPKPELWCGPLGNRRNPDGTYTVTCTLDVISPYPPAELSLQIEAVGIVSIDVVPNRPGLNMLGHSGMRDGWGFTSVINPSGRYTLSVVAVEPRFGIAYKFL